MKPSATINFLTFCVLSLAIGFAVFSMATSRLRSAEETRECLSDLSRLQAELSRDVVLFVSSDAVRHDQLGQRLRRSRSGAERLEGVLHKGNSLDSHLVSASERSVQQARQVCDLVEHIRSEQTVLRNACATLRRLLAGMILRSHNAPEIRRAIFEVETCLERLRPLGDHSIHAGLQASGDAFTSQIEEAGSLVAQDLRLVRAQIDKIVATAKFVDADLRALNSRKVNAGLADAMILATDAARQHAIHDQNMLRILTVFSTALVAFVAAGLWQFRAQAIDLAVLNQELETRVQQRTEELSESQAFLGLILDSLPSHICILDEAGKIIQTNAKWNAFSASNGGNDTGIGSNYLDICRGSSGDCRPCSLRLATAIEQISQDGEGTYVDEYPCHSPRKKQWFQVSVNPLARSSVGCVVVTHTCVTQRVLAEQELQQQKEEAERLALVARYTDNAVVITDADTRIEWVNEGFTRVAGYTREEVVGRSPGDLLQGEETDQATVEHMRSCLAEKKGFDVEILNYAKSGEKYWLAIEVRPIEDEHGEVVKYIAIESDISQRKQREDEMNELNQRLRLHHEEILAERRLLDAIINSLPHALFWKDSDSVYLGCNQVFADYVGLDNSEDIVGLTDYDLSWGAEKADEYRALDQEVMCEGRTIRDLEETRDMPSGEAPVIWLSKTPLRDSLGQVTGIVGLFRDVTEKKRSEVEREEFLAEAEKQRTLLNAVMESLDDGIIAASESGEFLCFNRGAENLLGKSAEACTGPEAWSEDYRLFETDGNTEVPFDQLPLSRAINGDTVSNREMIIRRDDGDVIISVNSAPIRSQEHSGGVAVFRDVTEQKQLESQLSQAQKLESIGQLSAGIAHEINTPMQFLSDNIEFLNECAGRLFKVVDRYRALLGDRTPLSWQQRRDEIDKISEACRFEHIRAQLPGAITECREGIERTVKIVKAMKDFSHPGAKEMTLADLNEAIESTVAISRNRWKYAAELELDLAPDLPKAPMYLAEVNQVLLNLVVNAADAVAERYGDAQLGRITIRTRHANGSLEVEVEDNGCGMPAHVKSKVFDPFFTTKEVGKGTGQGLSITHNVVVNLHGGSIDLDSEPGQGARFTVRLPITVCQLEPRNRISSGIPDLFETSTV